MMVQSIITMPMQVIIIANEKLEIRGLAAALNSVERVLMSPG